MKSIRFFNLMALGLALACGLSTGCKHEPTRLTVLPGLKSPTVKDPGAGRMTDEPGTRVTQNPTSSVDSNALPPREGHAGWIENASELSADTVYFDFDSAAIKASEKTKIETVAAYLKSNSDKAVRVEGHCDERGTEEYNRALGDRRALAVRGELLALGIAPERIDTISYGKDRPADTSHNDAAWKKNRRGAFILLSPPK